MCVCEFAVLCVSVMWRFYECLYLQGIFTLWLVWADSFTGCEAICHHNIGFIISDNVCLWERAFTFSTIKVCSCFHLVWKLAYVHVYICSALRYCPAVNKPDHWWCTRPALRSRAHRATVRRRLSLVTNITCLSLLCLLSFPSTLFLYVAPLCRLLSLPSLLWLTLLALHIYCSCSLSSLFVILPFHFTATSSVTLFLPFPVFFPCMCFLYCFFLFFLKRK